MNMTAQQVVQKSIDDFDVFVKFVKTKDGYFFGHHFTAHTQILPKGQTALSAGFIWVVEGKKFKLSHEWSSTLKLWPDDDVEGLSKALGLPGTKMN